MSERVKQNLMSEWPVSKLVLLVVKEKEMQMQATMRILQIRKIGSTNCWLGCATTRTLPQHWWECKAIQLTLRTVRQFL